MAIACYDIPGSYTQTASNYFQPTTGKTWAITAMFFTNRDGSSVQALDLWIIDTDVQALNTITNASQPQPKFTYIKQLGIPAEDTYINDVQRLILSDNNLFYWKAAQADKINAVISYMEI